MWRNAPTSSRSACGCPQPMPTGQESAFARDLFAGHRVSDVVTPGTVDMHVTGMVCLFTEAELFHHAAGRLVFRADVDFDAVQAAIAKRVVDHQRQRGRDDAAARDAPVDPIADISGTERPAYEV